MFKCFGLSLFTSHFNAKWNEFKPPVGTTVRHGRMEHASPAAAEDELAAVLFSFLHCTSVGFFLILFLICSALGGWLGLERGLLHKDAGILDFLFVLHPPLRWKMT